MPGKNQEPLEQRSLPVNELETREQDGIRTIAGYVVKWGSKSSPMGYFRRYREEFLQGAFTGTLAKDDQLALFSHDFSKVLGRTSSGTLRLREDTIGLHMELDLPNNTLGSDVYESIRRRDIDGLSMGFRMEKQSVDESDLDNVTRSIVQAKLVEVSPVALPAYPDSKVSTRSLDPFEDYLTNIEKQKNKRKRMSLMTY